MKCKRHPHENNAGVCASCLRDRLLILLADQHNHPSPERRPRKTHPHLFSDESRSTVQTRSRFSLFPSLFGSDDSETSASWFSALIHRQRSRETTVSYYVPSARGMSPAMDGQDFACSGCSPPRSDPDCRRRRRRGGGGLADFVVCLSPLVRPDPIGRRRRHQPPPTKESAFRGEIMRKGKPVHFEPNRSRKLTDRGRYRR